MPAAEKRPVVVAFRLTLREAAALDQAGQTLRHPRGRADFARAAALHAARQRVPEPVKPIRRPARRKPTLDVQELARILGQLGRIGNLLNQLAKVANGSGNLPTVRTLSAIATDMTEMRHATHEALAGTTKEDGGDNQDQ